LTQQSNNSHFRLTIIAKSAVFDVKLIVHFAYMEENDRAKVLEFLDVLETFLTPAGSTDQSFWEVMKSKMFWVRVSIVIATLVSATIVTYASQGSTSAGRVLAVALPILKEILRVLGPMPSTREIGMRLGERLDEEFGPSPK
jgi:hypothetical protein